MNDNKPFNPCSNCPHKDNRPTEEATNRVVITSPYNSEPIMLTLTNSQIRLLKYLQNEDMIDGDLRVAYAEDNHDWETI